MTFTGQDRTNSLNPGVVPPKKTRALMATQHIAWLSRPIFLLGDNSRCGAMLCTGGGVLKNAEYERGVELKTCPSQAGAAARNPATGDCR